MEPPLGRNGGPAEHSSQVHRREPRPGSFYVVARDARYLPCVTNSEARTESRSESRAVAAHIASLPVGFAFMLWTTRHLRFFGDEWAFILDRREMWARGRVADFLFLPHNEHWSTLPVLIYSATVKLFGLSSYIPYLCVLLAIHLLGVIAFRRLAIRVGASNWIATLTSGVFLVLGSGAEDLSWGFQIGFVGSVALGLFLLLLADSADSPGWLAPIVAVGCLMTSGVSVVMVLLACCVVVLRRQWGRLIQFGLIPAVCFAVWYAGWGRMTQAPAIRPVPSLMPPYVWRGVTNSIDGVSQMRGLAPAAIVAFCLLGARLWPAASRNALALTAITAPVALLTVNSLARASLGVEQSLASRYVYVCAPFILLAALASIKNLGGERTVPTLAVIVLAWAIVGNCAEFRRFAVDRGVIDAQAWHEVLGAAAVTALYSEPSTVQVEPKYSPDVRMYGLPDLIALGLPIREARPQDLTDAMGRFGLRVPTTESTDAASIELQANDVNTNVTSVGQSCWFLASPLGPANVNMRVVGTGRVTLTPQGDVDAVVYVHSDSGLDSPTRNLLLRGSASYEAVAIPGQLVIGTSNPVTICVGGPGS